MLLLNLKRVLFGPQVAVVDLNKSCGEECKAQLDAEFGEGNCTFIPCDVCNGDALRGTTVCREISADNDHLLLVERCNFKPLEISQHIP